MSKNVTPSRFSPPPGIPPSSSPGGGEERRRWALHMAIKYLETRVADSDDAVEVAAKFESYVRGD